MLFRQQSLNSHEFAIQVHMYPIIGRRRTSTPPSRTTAWKALNALYLFVGSYSMDQRSTIRYRDQRKNFSRNPWTFPKTINWEILRQQKHRLSWCGQIQKPEVDMSELPITCKEVFCRSSFNPPANLQRRVLPEETVSVLVAKTIWLSNAKSTTSPQDLRFRYALLESPVS